MLLLIRRGEPRSDDDLAVFGEIAGESGRPLLHEQPVCLFSLALGTRDIGFELLSPLIER